MFALRLKNFLIKAMGVYFDKEKYDNITIENISEQVFLQIVEFSLKEIISEVAIKLEEKFEKVKESDEGKSWISPYLHEYNEEISRIFERHQVEKGKVEGRSTKAILISILQLFRIPIEEKDIFLFERMAENRFKHMNKDNKINYSKLTYSQIIALIEEWAIKDSIKQLTFAANLENLITEYIELTEQCEYHQLIRSLKGLLKNLQAIQSEYSAKPIRTQDTILENRLKALKEIFHFYAKQLKMLGNAPTFDEITDHQSILNISKFTKFCNDFDITNKQNKDHLSVQQVSQAFLNGNDCSRTMNYSQFIAALDSLADMYYNEQYDVRNSMNYSILPITEKRNMLYEFLQLDNKNQYLQKAKGFGLPFSKEKAGYRLPDYDLSKNYKFKDTSQQKQKISEWKKSKEVKPSSLRSLSIPNPARLAAVKNSLLQRKDRITWEMLKNSQQSSLISKEELSNLFTESDIKEIMSSNKSNYKWAQ